MRARATSFARDVSRPDCLYFILSFLRFGPAHRGPGGGRPGRAVSRISGASPSRAANQLNPQHLPYLETSILAPIFLFSYVCKGVGDHKGGENSSHGRNRPKHDRGCLPGRA